MISDSDFSLWQKQLAPLLYDTFSHHNMTWPTQACRWGAMIEELSYKVKHRLYFSEQTDNTEPQKLIAANVDVCKPHVCSSEVVANWSEFSRCPYIKDQKVVFHPGEVNKIRELPQHPEIVITHTDSPDLYLWNMEKQPSRQREKATGKNQIANSVADLKLTGHEEDALFPLATSKVAPYVASGGNDKMVLLWSIQDHMESLLSSAPSGKEPELEARTKLRGHRDTVEDVVFKPDSTEQLVSVGDDHMVVFWDTRAGNDPSCLIELAHGKGQDIQCVDWDATTGYLVATGAQDGSLKIWDTRKVASSKESLATFRVHTGGVIRLEWHPTERGVLASGGEDRLIMVWKMNPDGPFTAPPSEVAGGKKGSKAAQQLPQELIFQHAGHRRGKVVDFQWATNPLIPWTVLSVSDDTIDEETGGGSLQIWRMNDLVWRDEDEVVAELEQHRDFILNGQNPPALPQLPIEKGQEEAAPAAPQAAAPAAEAAPDAVAAPSSAPEAAAPVPKTEPGTEAGASMEVEEAAAAVVAAEDGSKPAEEAPAAAGAEGSAGMEVDAAAQPAAEQAPASEPGAPAVVAPDAAMETDAA